MWFLFTCGAFSQEREFTGKLDPELLVPRSHLVSTFTLATDQERSRLPRKASPTDQVFVGKVRGRLAFVVEAEPSRTILYLDVNADATLNPNEEYSLGPGLDELQAGIARVLLPLPGPLYKDYPIDVYVYRKQKQDNQRTVGESPFAFVRGRVDVNGKPLVVEYQFDFKANTAHLDSCWQGMDANGDGEIDPSRDALEYFYAKSELLVFHVGERYLLTKNLDLIKGEVVLQSCPPAAYKTIELTVGAQLPEVSFTDFSGKQRALAEFRGKYVLLDFWTTWCQPCVADLDHLKEVYERFRGRGFEIIGMNGDEDEAAARKMIANRNLAWTHATYGSIRQTLERSFRIRGWPTYVLVDPYGTVVSSRDADVRGPALDRTLEALLR